MRRRQWLAAGLLVLVTGAVVLFLAAPAGVRAQTPEPPGPGDADGLPVRGHEEREDDDGPIQRIMKRVTHLMTFPVETMTAALTESITRMLQGAVEEAAAPFAAALETLVLGDVAHGPTEEIYGPAWRLLRSVSMALWPLTLGLVVVWAARGGVVDNPVSFANLKEGLVQWGLSVVLTLASAYLIGLGLRLSRGITGMILRRLWGPISARTITGIFFNVTLWSALLGMVPGAALFFGLFMLIFGFSLCTALIFAYVARYALLLLLISLAPLVMTLGVVPEVRWLYWLWLKGLVVTLLLGPANALLLKMAHVAAVSGLGDVPALFGGLVKFLAAGAMLSILLSIDYAVVKGVFGALGEIAGKAKSTAQRVVAGLVALGGMVVSGGVAGLGLGAAGAAGGGLLGGGGGGAAAAPVPGPGTGAGAGAAGAEAAAEGVGGASAAGSGSGVSAAKGAALRQAQDSGASGLNPLKTGSGAGATRAALQDPGFLRRMGSMLKTAGQAGSASRSPVGRAAAGVARGVGSVLTDRARRLEREDEPSGALRRGQQTALRHAQDEAQERAAHGGWEGLVEESGISPEEESFDDVTRSLNQLADRYGDADVRSVAPRVIRPMAAGQRHGGVSLQEHAEGAGYESPGQFVGGEAESWLGSGAGKPEEPLFPPSRSGVPETWRGSGPSGYDYRRGFYLGARIRRGGVDQIDPYARLAWAVRNPALGGGEGNLDQLRHAAGEAQRRGIAAEAEGGSFGQAAWPHFAQQARGITEGLGLASEDLPSAWLAERAFLAG